MTLLRRSELATPASNEWMFDKAARSGADLVFLDLEDAVAASAKSSARAKAVEALGTCEWGATTRAVRINSIDTEWAHDDVIEIVTGAREAIDTLIVRKVTGARDVWWVDVLLTQLEAKLGLRKPVRLEVLIEDVAGLDTNFVPTHPYPGDFWHYARNKVLVAARIGGSLAIDAPYPDYRDVDGYREDALRAAALGYSGKWAIIPGR